MLAHHCSRLGAKGRRSHTKLHMCGCAQDTIRQPLADGKVFLQGCDTQGRPVILVLGQRHFTATRDLGETLRLIIYSLDNSIALSDLERNPKRQIICLFDLGGAALPTQLNMVVDLSEGVSGIRQPHVNHLHVASLVQMLQQCPTALPVCLHRSQTARPLAVVA